jgi:hypothetical protein
MSMKKATEVLTAEIEKAEDADLIEYHNELFPEEKAVFGSPQTRIDQVRAKVLGHIKKGLEIEEVLSLWWVVFPFGNRIWYDEEANRFEFKEPLRIPPEE